MKRFTAGLAKPRLLVDDNFIGNKRDALRLLPVIAEWQKARGYPFSLFTEASVNLARMDDLMDAMIEAGFNSVFLGIETPNPRALAKTRKPRTPAGGTTIISSIPYARSSTRACGLTAGSSWALTGTTRAL